MRAVTAATGYTYVRSSSTSAAEGEVSMSPLALRDVALATVTGIVAGFAFGKLRLPVPAPPTLAGVLGIVGMTIGYALARRF